MALPLALACSMQDIGAGEMQETIYPWDTSNIHPVRQRRAEAICHKKDQDQHPPQCQRAGYEDGL